MFAYAHQVTVKPVYDNDVVIIYYNDVLLALV